MTLSNSAENNLLKLLFTNTTWANIGDATGIVGSGGAGSLYVSLHTADPGEAGDQTTNECAYGAYARVAVARTAGGWTVTNDVVANTAIVSFPAATSGSETATHFAVGRASSGAGEILVSAALTGSLVIVAPVKPTFAAGALTATAA